MKEFKSKHPANLGPNTSIKSKSKSKSKSKGPRIGKSKSKGKHKNIMPDRGNISKPNKQIKKKSSKYQPRELIIVFFS